MVYSLLGAMGLSLVAVFLHSGSLSTTAIVAAQAHGNWYCVLLLPSFLTYTITTVGEPNRIPFDLPEGEGEPVGVCLTEYSSLKFAMPQRVRAGWATTTPPGRPSQPQRMMLPPRAPGASRR